MKIEFKFPLRIEKISYDDGDFGWNLVDDAGLLIAWTLPQKLVDYNARKGGSDE